MLIGQCCHQSRRAVFIHVQFAPDFPQALAKGLCNPLDHGERADEDNGNLTADQQAILQGYDPLGVRSHHDI